MIVSRSHYYLLKFTLEAQSAHAIHTGQGDTTHDSLITRDANGLPTITGSSLAGVLRHAYQQYFDEPGSEQKTNALFGYADGNDGQSSWLTVGWGLVHDSHNQAHEGLLTDEQLNDSLYTLLKNKKPIVRQRVNLNERGVANDMSKFDVTLVPAGVRYGTWISYWCDGSSESQALWQNLLVLLTTQPLHIGHGIKNGYGEFTVCDLYQGHWDLKTPTGREGFCQLNRARTDKSGLSLLLSDDINNSDISKDMCQPVKVCLDVAFESAWRVGGGEQYLGNESEQYLKDEIASQIKGSLPMHEYKITWKDNKAQINTQDDYLLPASAIKGALRHRVAYHYNCLSGYFADVEQSYDTDDNLAVKTLFGYAKDKDAQVGIIAIQDVYLPGQESQIVKHNKIDHYTGGAINGALFSEVILWQSNFQIRLDITKPDSDIDTNIKKALQLALEDLIQGWLPLGANGSRGLGVLQDLTGKGIQWSDNQQWINTEEAL